MDKVKDRPPQEERATEKAERAREAGFWTILGFGAYFIILSVLLLYVVIKIWLTSDTVGSPTVFFGFIELCVEGEVRLIVIAAVFGALGSLTHAMTSFATYVGNRRFMTSWTWWFILRPFIGMPLALIFYFVVRGGFFTLVADTNAVSSFGIAGLAGLVGMFSKQAIDKLREIFEDIFKTTKPDQRTDKLQDHSEQS